MNQREREALLEKMQKERNAKSHYDGKKLHKHGLKKIKKRIAAIKHKLETRG